MKYEVDLVALARMWCRIEVENADSAEDATRKAIEEAKHGDFVPDWEPCSVESEYEDHHVVRIEDEEGREWSPDYPDEITQPVGVDHLTETEGLVMSQCLSWRVVFEARKKAMCLHALGQGLHEEDCEKAIQALGEIVQILELTARKREGKR